MDPISRFLENKTISGSLLVGAITLLVWAHAWANETFVTRDEFQTLKQTMDDGFEENRLDGASQTIRLLKVQIGIAQATGGDIGGLQEDLDRAKSYEDCLVHREPNCDHLKVR